MKNSDFLVIQGWMVSVLGLMGSELLAYALVYSFSRDGASWFTGSQSYIAGWLGIKRENVNRVLRRMVERGLLEQQKMSITNGVIVTGYRAIIPDNGDKSVCYEASHPCDETSHPCDETSHPCDETSHMYNKDNIHTYPAHATRARKGEDFDFREEILKLGVVESVADDWLKARAAKKGINSRTALRAIKKAIDRCCADFGVTANDCIHLATVKGWRGFEYEWFKNWHDEHNNNGNEQHRKYNRQGSAQPQFGGYGTGTL